MSLQTYPHIEQRSEEWYEVRRGIVTASTIGSLITSRRLTGADYDCPSCDAPTNTACVSKRTGAPIQTLHPERAALARSIGATALEAADDADARALTALLVSERITGWTEETYTSADMLRGIMDEPVARATYREHHAPVTEMGFMVRTTDGGHRLGYSPDGLVGDAGLIEIKSRTPKEQVRLVLADEIPSGHMAQMQAGMLVAGREWCDYVSFCGGLPLWVMRVERDDEWVDVILDALYRFETVAADMVARFGAACEGMPPTERQNYYDADVVVH